MSYDIRFGVKVADASEDCYAVIGEPELSSPTYNVGTIFRESMDWDFTQGEWYKVTDVIPKLERGVHELSLNAKAYRKHEPDNGWGSVASALECLQSILKWLSSDLERGWNGDIPIECIYMCW